MAVRAYTTTDNPSSDRLARRALAAAIESAITLLDKLDDDTDLEESSDAEPWLGWHGAEQGCAVTIANPGEDDRELDCDSLEHDGDSDIEDGGDAEYQDEDGSEIDVNPDAWVRA